MLLIISAAIGLLPMLIKINLEERFLALAITMSTNPMRRILGFMCWLESINKAASGKLKHGVISFFSFPLFVCCEFLSQGFILTQERQLIILSDRTMPDVNLGRCCRKLRQSLSPFGIVAGFKRCLNYIGYVAKGS